MDDPVEFFASDEIDNKSEQLSSDLDKALSWEQQCVSVYSSGIVDNSEVVARLVFSPIHIDKDTGELTPAAFDDVSNKGLSVNRLSLVDIDKIHKLGIRKQKRDNKAKKKNQKPPDRKYLGTVTAKVEKIRQLEEVEKNTRIFGVYDTALKVMRHHADVFMINQNYGVIGKKAAKKAWRYELKESFGKLESPEPNLTSRKQVYFTLLMISVVILSLLLVFDI